MKLSVIIVNYNVKFFLEQCLYSVTKATSGIDSEIFVVDNNSVDGSVAMIRLKFPGVHLIQNETNLGFAKANNQAIRIAKGKYIVLLNPDTVVEEVTFSKCLAYMDAHPDTGALGPKMIDGKGRYLPESKRGLPTPEVAFYKIFGLARLFPRSKKFARYYLGHTRPEVIQEIEVLTGAFMFIRRDVFHNAGLLDEEYFMYGEDIDFSYRISKAGYKLVYFPETTIIHYKGESAKKGSLNYVVIFYKAMEIFARKYFSGNVYRTYSWLIHTAIYLRAGLSIVKRGLLKIIPFAADALISFAGIFLITKWWAKYHFRNPGYYSADVLFGAIPVLVLIFLLSNLLAGSYRFPFKMMRVFKGVTYGLIAVLAIYALLPSQFRFSRAIIIFSALFVNVTFFAVRFFLSFVSNSYRIDLKTKKRLAIVGFEDECERIKSLLGLSGVVARQIVNVSPGSVSNSEYFSGTIGQLKDIVEIYQIDEIVFSASDISSQEIIEKMKSLQETEVDFKIASPESSSIIGSNSKRSSGDLYVVRVDHIEKRKIGGT